ncbi:hypothetical protein pkur_cds_492 [Pandoravirus kuranda]|uniref:F-box incomplete domain containing protein n=1 Tax=Pandoravirus kuranda TaxID=3019033 RepID=A0AA95EN93_9VIRU|nr:hypothetical protein pkur_cds_492 [Pandoravirus kuranda]
MDETSDSDSGTTNAGYVNHDHDDDGLYDDIEAPQASLASSSYFDMLPRELVSLVAVHVARSDTSALGGLASIATHARQSIAATRVPLPWLPRCPTATLDRVSQLAKALGACGIDDIADRARRCVILAYIDWVAASARDDVPDAVMAAGALVGAAQSITDLTHLCRLVVGCAETCRRGRPVGGIPISGLGAQLTPSQLRDYAGRSICKIDHSVLRRMIDAYAGECNGVPAACALRRWMDDAIDAAAKKRCPGAFAVAPEAMPRFSDLFAIDGARATFAGTIDFEFFLVGQLRQRW